MARVALLIGVSEYGSGLNPLPGAVMDVDAMQRVLVNPEMGDFASADITVLKNPQRQAMEDAIYWLFDDRNRDDLLLFYFSGHGIKDESNNLYLGTCETRKNSNGKLYEPSAVDAMSIHRRINNSRSQHQVLILDCCFSGAIAQGMTVKDDGIVNLENYLGGKGRAILTSSTATEYSFGAEVTADEKSGLSIYTRYLVEGIETGAADADEDDLIAVQELHEYASKRVKEAAPAMNPEFYPVKEGYKIILAKSRHDDPKLKYRKEVQRRFNQGQIEEFSIFAMQLLDNQRNDWGLSVEEAKAIENEFLQPHREYKRKRQRYEQVLTQAVQTQYPFDPVAESDLTAYQKYLKLRDADIAEIEQRVLEPRKVEYERQQAALNQPEQVSRPINPSTSRQPFQLPDIFPRRNFLKWAGFAIVGLLGTLWWAQTHQSSTPTTPVQLVTPAPVPLLR
jgi:uncharacterized caspase-like protein